MKGGGRGLRGGGKGGARQSCMAPYVATVAHVASTRHAASPDQHPHKAPFCLCRAAAPRLFNGLPQSGLFVRREARMPRREICTHGARGTGSGAWEWELGMGGWTTRETGKTRQASANFMDPGRHNDHSTSASATQTTAVLLTHGRRSPKVRGFCHGAYGAGAHWGERERGKGVRDGTGYQWGVFLSLDSRVSLECRFSLSLVCSARER